MCSDIKCYLIRLLINSLKNIQEFLYKVLMFHTIIHTLFAVHLVRNFFSFFLRFYFIEKIQVAYLKIYLNQLKLPSTLV